MISSLAEQLKRDEMKLLDIANVRFGKLVALEQVPCPRDAVQHRRRVFWRCQCDCGNKVILDGSSLRGQSRSCGCGRSVSHFIHGRGGSVGGKRDQQYSMWVNAKQRARLRGLEFNLDLFDIEVPSHCPVLGIELRRGAPHRGPSDNSPTLDRINLDRGYVRGNIKVISFRANRLKSNGTIDEIENVLAYMKSHSHQ